MFQPIKRHRLLEWIKKQDPTISCLQLTHFNCKQICNLKVKRWRKISHANTNQTKAGAGILISDRADFRTRKIRNIERHYVMIKRSVVQEDIKIFNVYAPNNRALIYVRQKLNRTMKSNRWIHYYTWRLWYLFIRNGQIQQAEDQ